jgi:hypothetical protein
MKIAKLTRRMSWMEHVTQVGKARNTYKILVGRSERKTSA